MERCVYVPETAFSFLKPAMKKNSGKFGRPYSHWGITEISREEWQSIVRDWERLKKEISSANTAHEICYVHPMTPDLNHEFGDGFDCNKFALLKMIDELHDWVCRELTEHDRITVVGI